jgi:hypothetical protein
MKMQMSRSRIGILVCGLVFAGLASAAAPSKQAIYSDVQITYAGQTFGFGGVQGSFNQNQDGGFIQLNVTNLDTPGYVPLPQIDTGSLRPKGNHWEVVTQLGSHHAYSFVGICASTTFATTEATGTITRHLYLNCSDLETASLP